MTTRLILASSSPRRRQLLAEAGYEFEVVAPPIEEPGEPLHCLRPAQHAEVLAYFKARAVADRNPCAAVLGADTIVIADGEVLGKPADADDARRMLGKLSGAAQDVITGIALLEPDGSRLIASDTTAVTMREISVREIDDYIDSGEWKGKAGAYAIQETADRFVTRVDGSFSNVVGLPVELVARMLSEIRRNPQRHRRV